MSEPDERESDERLEEYGEKRDLGSSDEPAGDGGELEWADGRPVFVIQEHAASSHHWDFRLEVDGALESWAVPKGPSTDPSEKRLALPTEPHPLEYGDFEGAIPEDEYGGGEVIVWDRGTYRNLKEEEAEEGEEAKSVAEQIEDGHATVWLEGEKLRGGYALIRTGSGDDARWLLIKMDDEEADARREPTSSEPESVKSGRTVEEIAGEGGEEEGG